MEVLAQDQRGLGGVVALELADLRVDPERLACAPAIAPIENYPGLINDDGMPLPMLADVLDQGCELGVAELWQESARRVAVAGERGHAPPSSSPLGSTRHALRISMMSPKS
jgi:hypothetical protein